MTTDKRYPEALDWLFSQLPMFSRTGAAAYKPGLDNVIALDRLFGNPHRKFRSIHVAGTNGKGSVSHYLASILQEEGYKTGLYTSPHLVDFRERIRVNGRKIPQQQVADFVERFRGMATELHPSFFELTMMMAFDYFAKEEVDYAVIEVGMGGRLDSTNIITPEGCVITNISKDHTQFLGSTLEEIAGEKAGIIKRGVPVTIGEATGSIRELFEKKAKEMEAPVRFADEESRIEGPDFNPKRFKDREGNYYTTPLAGDYQRLNLNTVLTAVDMLRKECDVRIKDESIRKGIENVVRNTSLMGRWMTINEKPKTIADTGHNLAGMASNMRQLEKMMRSGDYRKLRMLIGFVADKDVSSILSLISRDAELYITNASIPRALLAKELAGKCSEAGLKTAPERVSESVKEGWESMLADSSADDLLYVGGSTFVVADLMQVLNIGTDE